MYDSKTMEIPIVARIDDLIITKEFNVNKDTPDNEVLTLEYEGKDIGANYLQEVVVNFLLEDPNVNQDEYYSTGLKIIKLFLSQQPFVIDDDLHLTIDFSSNMVPI